MKKGFTAKATSGIAFFAALLPIAFSFGKGRTQFLVSSGFDWAVWAGLGISAMALLAYGRLLNKSELTGLAVLYALVPFTFYFSNGDARLLVLGANTAVAVACWAVALLLFVQVRTRKAMQS